MVVYRPIFSGVFHQQKAQWKHANPGALGFPAFCLGSAKLIFKIIFAYQQGCWSAMWAMIMGFRQVAHFG